MKSLRWTICSSSRVGLLRMGLIRRGFCETINKGGGGGEDGKDSSTDDTKNNAPIPTVSNTGGGPGTMSERGEETRGALKNFMATQKEGMKGDGLWARLRREANPMTPSFQQQQQQPPSSSQSSSSGEGEGGNSSPPRRSWSSPKHPQSLRPSSPDPSSGERGSGNDEQQRGRMPMEQRNTSRSGDSDSSRGTMNRPPPRRSFNPRGGAKGNSAPRVFASASSDDGGNNFAGGGGSSSGGRKKRRGTGPEGEGSGGGGRFGDSMPPAVKAMLDDEAFFQAIQKGYSIDTRGLDGIDVFLAEVYLNSLKTSDARVRTVVESPGLRRTQLPKPRPIHQLIASMRPMITSVPEGSEGHKLGMFKLLLISP